MNPKTFLLIAMTLALGAPGSRAADTQILSLSPVGDHSCVAAPIQLADGESLSGIRWLNNDSSQAFPRLLLMEGTAGSPPDINETGMILQEITGESLAWGEVYLDTQVTSSTGLIYAVWVFPAQATTTGRGEGQGPGLGLAQGAPGLPFYLSADGLEWLAFDSSFRLQVEPLTGSVAARSTASPVALSDLAAKLAYTPDTTSDQATPPRLPTATDLHPARPNPFNPRTAITYDLAAAGPVSLRVFDVRGRLVKNLESAERPAGSYRLVWNGDDDTGAPVASGVYYVRFQAADVTRTERMTLVR